MSRGSWSGTLEGTISALIEIVTFSADSAGLTSMPRQAYTFSEKRKQFELSHLVTFVSYNIQRWRMNVYVCCCSMTVIWTQDLMHALPSCLDARVKLYSSTKIPVSPGSHSFPSGSSCLDMPLIKICANLFLNMFASFLCTQWAATVVWTEIKSSFRRKCAALTSTVFLI